MTSRELSPTASRADRSPVRSPGAVLARSAGLPALVTALVFLPQLATDPDEVGPVLSLVWLAVLLSAAPVVAAVLSRRSPWGPARSRRALVGVPQLFVVLLLVRLDTWLEVRRGYLLAGSGEEAMSYGIGLAISVLVGSVLAVLVTVATRPGEGHRADTAHER